ncbi:MAG: N-acetylmuramic acid 6-phosphate etherase [Anaerolineae bacterium]|jgi:N-acetylmuramic acid 6-phosphate etherase|nr:N-acetylmuramic acid 6-phosphate etherase [Anaerolineae bacterium]
MLTEQTNPRTRFIDRMSTVEMLHAINDEDRQVALAVQEAIPRVAEAVEAIVERLERGGRLFYVGAGTSGRLGVMDAAECVPTFSTPPELVVALMAGGDLAVLHSVEGAEDDAAAGEHDLLAHGAAAQDAVVGIAASGTTPYVLGALRAAAAAGAVTIGIACNVPAPLLDLAQIKIGVPVGAEVITGSTRLKAGTAQKMILNMLSTATFIKLGKVYGNLMVDVQVTNEKLARRARQIVAQIADMDENSAADLLARSDKNVKVAIVMARRGVSADDARALLAKSGGRLRDVIG